MAGSTSGLSENLSTIVSMFFLDFRPLAYEKNLFEGTKKVLLETVMSRVAFFCEGLFWRISNTSLKLV